MVPPMNKPRTLLLVEDEVLIAMEEARLLEDEGYDVLMAHSGKAAIKTAAENRGRIDLILMDIDLGSGMDGTEAAREILREHDIPVVFLSSHTEPDIVERTEKITSYGYVVKNTGATVLSVSLKMAFRLHEANQHINAKNMEAQAANEELSAVVEEMESANEELASTNEELEATNEELIRSQSELLASEERYHNLFSAMNDGVCLHELIYDAEGKPSDYRIIDINPRYSAITGISREEALGSLASVLYGSGSPPYLDIYSHTALTGEAATFETYYPPMDRHFIITVFSPGKGSFATVFQDITERKRMELALRESEESYRLLADNSTDMISRHGPDGTYLYASPACRILFGYDPEELIGRSALEFIHPDDLRLVEESRARVSAGPAAENILFRFRSRNGLFVWVEATSRSLIDPKTGQVREIQVATRDVSARKVSEEQAQAYISMLENLERVDRVIRESEDLGAMIIRMLDTVRGIFGSDRAWLLYPCDPSAATFQVRMIRTGTEYPVALDPDTNVPVSPNTAEAFGMALESPDPVIFDPTTRRDIPLGTDFSILSQIIQVVRPKSDAPWLFGMHQCSHARIWTPGESHLFQEIARRMTDGLNSLILLGNQRESEERLRTLINAMPDIVCFKDGAGRWLEANDFDLALFELTGRDYRGKKDSDLADYSAFYRHTFLACEETDELAWTTGMPTRHDETIPLPDGSLKIFDIIKVPMFHPDGSRKGLVVIGRDITERIRAEEDLRESEERFRNIVDSVTDYIYTVKLEGGQPAATSHGPACVTVTGYHPEEYAADPDLWYRMIHEEDRNLVESQTARLLAGEDAPSVEHRILHRDGSIRWVRNTAVLIRDSQDRLQGYDGLIVDITERKSAEERLARSVHEKEILLKELQHRVKNNLGVIKSLLSLELQNLRDDHSREIFQNAIRRILSMATLYDQLSRSSGLDSVDLKKYIAAITQQLFDTYEMDSDRISLSLKLDEVKLDTRRTVPLGLILNEILTNTLKYAYPAGGKGEIRVGLVRNGETIALTISDDGVGLPRDVREGKVRGMGMQLVNMLVHQIGAELTVETGSGTTSRITLPSNEEA